MLSRVIPTTAESEGEEEKIEIALDPEGGFSLARWLFCKARSEEISRSDQETSPLTPWFEDHEVLW